MVSKFAIYYVLWADDPILLALDAKSLQSLQDRLHDYAEKWELSVIISKTKVMVFNTIWRILKCAKPLDWVAWKS